MDRSGKGNLNVDHLSLNKSPLSLAIYRFRQEDAFQAIDGFDQGHRPCSAMQVRQPSIACGGHPVRGGLRPAQLARDLPPARVPPGQRSEGAGGADGHDRGGRGGVGRADACPRPGQKTWNDKV